MNTQNSSLEWTEEQWQKIHQVVHDEAHRARVAASFLPMVGPLPKETETVPVQTVTDERIEDRLRGESQNRLAVDDRKTMPLTSISANVYLRNSQVAQADLSSAILMFRRVANVIARVEDAIIFNGLDNGELIRHGDHKLSIPPIFKVTKHDDGPQYGLLHAGRKKVEVVENDYGAALVQPVVNAISYLESNGHLGPFALALGNKLYGLAFDPEKRSLVLPADRIKPLLDGPLVRTSTLPDNYGILVSLAGDPIDLVVASEIATRFLHTTTEPRHVYRTAQRILLRVKQPTAVVTIKLGK